MTNPAKLLTKNLTGILFLISINAITFIASGSTRKLCIFKDTPINEQNTYTCYTAGRFTGFSNEDPDIPVIADSTIYYYEDGVPYMLTIEGVPMLISSEEEIKKIEESWDFKTSNACDLLDMWNVINPESDTIIVISQDNPLTGGLRASVKSRSRAVEIVSSYYQSSIYDLYDRISLNNDPRAKKSETLFYSTFFTWDFNKIKALITKCSQEVTDTFQETASRLIIKDGTIISKESIRYWPPLFWHE